MRLISIALLLLSVTAKAQTGDFVIQGKVGNYGAPAKVYIGYQLKLGGGAILDSAPIQNGAFRFHGSVPSPVSATLVISERGYMKGEAVRIYLEPGTLSVNSPDSLRNATISGGEINTDYFRLGKLLAPFNEKRVVLTHEYESAPKEKHKEILARFDSLDAPIRTINLGFVEDNPDRLMSIFALREYAGYIPDEAETERLFNKLSPRVRTSRLGMDYAAELAKLKAVAVGAVAPDFTEPDTAGAAISLHDFRGEYVLVDFWASWCVPCRQENPTVVKAYTKYRDKGLHILGVSQDVASTKAAWLKAIVDDHLTWTHVADLKGMYKNEVTDKYSVMAIPQNFLIGPDGKIVAVNLHGDALDKKLSEIFK
jgi:peroxiredoxin